MSVDYFLFEFQVGFWANLLSSIIALLLGIPIGLSVDRVVQGRQARHLRLTIYRALKDETIFNVRRMMDALVTCRADGSGAGILIGRPSSVAWMAVINGGQIGILEEPDLLQLCFRLYRTVDGINMHFQRLEIATIGDPTVLVATDRNVRILRRMVGNAAREGMELALAVLDRIAEIIDEPSADIAGMDELLQKWDQEKATFKQQLDDNHG
jgi:hypothetical protein